MGVPKIVRGKVLERINEAGGGRLEENFDLIHYQSIIKEQWPLLKPVLAYGDSRVGKARGTSWLGEVNTVRNKVMHPSRSHNPTFEELNMLEKYDTWVRERIANSDTEVAEEIGD